MNRAELERKVCMLYDLYWSGYMAMGIGNCPDAQNVKEQLNVALAELKEAK